MVDYNQRKLRDESWWRWKGGKKLAAELNQFYTTKAAWDRIARQNAMGPTQPASSPTTCKGCEARREWLQRLGRQMKLGAMVPFRRKAAMANMRKAAVRGMKAQAAKAK